jgi:hypothetical protein
MQAKKKTPLQSFHYILLNEELSSHSFPLLMGHLPFSTCSLDLSLAPNIVGALSPTVGGSLQVAGFTLNPFEGS